MPSTQNKSNLIRIWEGATSALPVIQFIWGIALTILFFGYTWRDTAKTSAQEVQDLKTGQETIKQQVNTARSERITQFDELKKEIKTDLREGKQENIKQVDLLREDLKRIDAKLDRLIIK